MNTRKINELPVLQQATAETNVLVEQNGTASRIPASALGGGGGSEKALIDKLAPAFKKTGAVVTCNPVEGHPLEVVSYIAPASTPYLIPDDIVWDWDEGGVLGQACIPNFPAGTYTAYVSEDWLGVRGEGVSNTVDVHGGESVAFTTTQDGDLYLYLNAPELAEECTIKLEKVGAAEHENVVLTVNDNTYTAEFPKAVSRGAFNWSTGVLTEGNPNLVADYKDASKWHEDEYETFNVYEIDLPSGEYTVFAGYSDVAVLVYVEWDEEAGMEINDFREISACYGTNEPDTFHHKGGVLRIADAGGGQGYDLPVLKLEAGTEYTGEEFNAYQLTPHEILGLAGVNNLKSNTGDTEVSGRADPTFVINDLYSKVNALMEG